MTLHWPKHIEITGFGAKLEYFRGNKLARARDSKSLERLLVIPNGVGISSFLQVISRSSNEVTVFVLVQFVCG